MKFIALRSIERDSGTNYADEEQRPSGIVRRESTTIDESREKGQKFVNPSLVEPLEKLWIKGVTSDSNGDSNGDSVIPPLSREESAASIVSLGDAHIWRNDDAT